MWPVKVISPWLVDRDLVVMVSTIKLRVIPLEVIDVFIPCIFERVDVLIIGPLLSEKFSALLEGVRSIDG